MLNINEIDFANRAREDLGDIQELAASIATLGLIQPLILTPRNRLMVGGRRLEALKLIGTTDLVEGKHFIYHEEVPESRYREIELEENVRRKEMSWKEKVKMIAEIHQLKKNAFYKSGDEGRWGYRETAEALGIGSHASVNVALTLCEELAKPNSVVHKAINTREALVMLVDYKADKAAQELQRRHLAKIKSMPSVPVAGTLVDELISNGFEVDKDEGICIPISTMVYNMDALTLMDALPDESVDHALTDFPYAIDMDNLQQAGMGMDITITKDEHGVVDNAVFVEQSIRKMYRILKPNSFFVFFYDLDWHAHWQDIAVQAGFKVQRWPFVWVKTSPCQNGAPHTNFTKATEVAMICRKGTPTLVSPQATNYYYGGLGDCKTKFNHPFAKPEELWLTLIRAISIEGQCIYDPCAGVGSGTIAVLSCNRVALASEIDATQFVGLQDNVKKFYASRNPGKKLIYT